VQVSTNLTVDRTIRGRHSKIVESQQCDPEGKSPWLNSGFISEAVRRSDLQWWMRLASVEREDRNDPSRSYLSRS